jgi:hypothetical protein
MCLGTNLDFLVIHGRQFYSIVLVIFAYHQVITSLELEYPLR